MCRGDLGDPRDCPGGAALVLGGGGTSRNGAGEVLPTPSGPDEFTAYIRSELKKWGDVVKMAGIKAE